MNRLSHEDLPQHVEVTGVVEMGSTPGAKAGWECADCDASTGMAFGSRAEAQRSLDVHLASDHKRELP